MKKFVKKTLALLLSFIMLLSVTPAIAMAAGQELPEESLKAGTRNVALGKVITTDNSSGEYFTSGCEALYATDGSNQTYASLVAKDPVITLDLEKTFKLEKVYIYLNNADANTTKIEISNDMSVWETIGNALSGTFLINNNNEYRYVRITADTNSVMSNIQFREIKVFAKADETVNNDSYSVANTVTFDEQNIKAKIAVMSDTHINEETRQHDKLIAALDAIDSFGGVDAIAINGDTVTNGYQDDEYKTGYAVQEYDYLVKVLNEHETTKNIPKIISIGNHELTWEGSLKTAVGTVAGHYAAKQKRFTDALSRITAVKNTTLNSTNVIDNAVVITVGLAVADALSYGGLEDNAAWLSEELAKVTTEEETKDLPIFVLCHYPPARTIQRGTTDALNPLHEVLKEFPQVTAFASHTHRIIDNPASFWQGEYTVINTGAITGVSENADASDIYGFANGAISSRSQFLLTEVDENGVVRIRPYDLLDGEFINSGYIYKPTDSSSFVYNTKNRKLNSGSPKFSQDAAVTVTASDYNSITISFLQASDPDVVGGIGGIVTGYRIKAVDPDKNVIVNEYISSNYWDCPDELTYTFTGLNDSTTYDIEITPVDEWETFGNSLTGTVATKEIVIPADYNIAKGKNVTTSEKFNNPNLSTLVDGKEGTQPAINGTGSGFNINDIYFQIDFGKAMPVEMVSVYGDANGNDFSIYLSNDPQFIEKKFVASVKTLSGTGYDYFDVCDPSSYRYMRLAKNSTANRYFKLFEVGAYTVTTSADEYNPHGNIAFDKPVYCGYNQTNFNSVAACENLTDGTSASWSAYSGNAAKYKPVIDLRNYYDVEKVVLKIVANASNNGKGLTIKASANRKFYNSVNLTPSVADADMGGGALTNTYTLDSTVANGRKFRYIMLDQTTYNYLYEVMVYARDNMSEISSAVTSGNTITGAMLNFEEGTIPSGTLIAAVYDSTGCVLKGNAKGTYTASSPISGYGADINVTLTTPVSYDPGDIVKLFWWKELTDLTPDALPFTLK